MGVSGVSAEIAEWKDRRVKVIAEGECAQMTGRL